MQHSGKNREMMDNPNEDGCTKTLNHQKVMRKKDNVMKSKRLPKQKDGLNGIPLFTLSLPGKQFTSLPPHQFSHCRPVMQFFFGICTQQESYLYLL